MNERTRAYPEFQVVGIAHDRAGIDVLLKAADDTPGIGFGLMLRDPGHDSEKVGVLADYLKGLAVPGNVTPITNGCAIDGIGWRHLTSAELRLGLRPEGPFGCSVHSAGEAKRAYGLGASYLLAGAIYVTESKPGARPAGATLIRDCAGVAPIPIFAIGGIVSPERAAECLDLGAIGIAGISLVRPGNRSMLDAIVRILKGIHHSPSRSGRG